MTRLGGAGCFQVIESIFKCGGPFKRVALSPLSMNFMTVEKKNAFNAFLGSHVPHSGALPPRKSTNKVSRGKEKSLAMRDRPHYFATRIRAMDHITTEEK